MARKSEGKTETLNLRVSADFKKRLAEEAVKERRSVTNYLEVTLLDIWDQSQQKVASKKNRGGR